MVKLTKNDLLIIGAYFAGALIAIPIAKESKNRVFLLFFFVYLVLGIGLLIALVMSNYRKLQALQQHQKETAYWQHRQTQAMFSLLKILPIRRPLPPLTDWAITPDFANILAGLVLRYQPKTIVELGSGSSTLINACLLHAAGTGKVISLDHEEKYAEKTRQMLDFHGYSAQAEVRYAPLAPFRFKPQPQDWYAAEQWENLESIDLLVVDGPPRRTASLARYPALHALFSRLSPDAIIIMDDYRREEEKEIVQKWLQEFPGLQIEEIECEKGACILRRIPKQS